MTAKRRTDWGAVGIAAAIIALIIFGLAWGIAMIWWLVWSILDLAGGNPATWWNILGIIIPTLSLLGSVFGGKK